MISEEHYHEALDRTHVMLEELRSRLSDHPTFKKNKRLRKKLKKAASHLSELYQMIGEEMAEEKKLDVRSKAG